MPIREEQSYGVPMVYGIDDLKGEWSGYIGGKDGRTSLCFVFADDVCSTWKYTSSMSATGEGEYTLFDVIQDKPYTFDFETYKLTIADDKGDVTILFDDFTGTTLYYDIDLLITKQQNPVFPRPE